MRIGIYIILVGLLYFSCNRENNNTKVYERDIPDEKVEEGMDDFVNVELKRKKVLNKSLSFLIPVDFSLMTNDEKSLKYPGHNAPQEVWANEERDVNIGFSNTGQILPETELKMYVSQVAEGIKQNISGSKWYGVKLKEINGEIVGTLEFITPANGGEIYNLMCFTVVNQILIMYSFNCTFYKIEEWNDVAEKIIESLKVE